MKQQTPATTYLKDYRPAPFQIEKLFLDFALEPKSTRVKSRIHIRPIEMNAPLVLSGEAIRLVSVGIDGRVLAATEYSVDEENLTIPDLPASPFLLEIETVCDPAGNTVLSGLYQSNGVFCTQCEAEGFRRIT